MDENKILQAIIECLDELARGNPNPNLMDERVKFLREQVDDHPARRGARVDVGKKSNSDNEAG